jgi:hypothetical protein
MSAGEQTQNVNHSLSRLDSYADDAQYSVYAVKSIDKIGISADPTTIHPIIDLHE